MCAGGSDQVRAAEPESAGIAEVLIAVVDLLIAAIALASDATLVARNVAELSRVPGLGIENWFSMR